MHTYLYYFSVVTVTVSRHIISRRRYRSSYGRQSIQKVLTKWLQMCRATSL